MTSNERRAVLDWNEMWPRRKSSENRGRAGSSALRKLALQLVDAMVGSVKLMPWDGPIESKRKEPAELHERVGGERRARIVIDEWECLAKQAQSNTGARAECMPMSEAEASTLCLLQAGKRKKSVAQRRWGSLRS